MDKKIIIGVVIVIVVAILGAYFWFSTPDHGLVGGDCSVILPSDYTVEDNGFSHKGDIGIYFVPINGTDGKKQKEYFDAYKTYGKDCGYQNVSSSKINGFKVYEYSANPDELKNITTDTEIEGNYEVSHVISTYTPYKDVTDMDVVKFRYVSYVDKNDKLYELYILTNNTDADLHSGEISKIINSISTRK